MRFGLQLSKKVGSTENSVPSNKKTKALNISYNCNRFLWP